jgi:hypothetical protein
MRLTGRKGCFAALGEAAQVSKFLFVLLTKRPSLKLKAETTSTCY